MGESGHGREVSTSTQSTCVGTVRAASVALLCGIKDQTRERSNERIDAALREWNEPA